MGIKRVSTSTEAALIASMTLFSHVIPYLSDMKIMDNLQVGFLKQKHCDFYGDILVLVIHIKL